jgi:serine/threonine protein kinase/Tol biopolymer transport system component
MGEVYRAKDTRLDRTVAIKVLPAQVTDRADLRQRLEREARAVSSLNHPHICALFDIGQQDGFDFLVMEYLEGESLAQRLTKGALPLDQVLRYAIEIADALDQAHRHGITHRDLKPGNIMLTRSGAKLLDFGLAKLRGPEPVLSSQSSLPTEARALTEKGTLLGTLQYMAPEQLEGKDTDARTDIFAFGAVLHEMATGRKAFQGKSQASLIAAILEHEPAAISTLQPLTPLALDRVVRKCLTKDPEERWQSAHDLKAELKWIAESGSQSGRAATALTRRQSRERLAWGLAALGLLTALLALAVPPLYRTPSETPLLCLSVATPQGTAGTSLFAISPDGRKLVLGSKGGLWVRPLGSLEAQPLPGTENAQTPFWSADSRFIGFLADGKIRKVEASGGPPQTMCNAPGVWPRGGSWNREGVILFATEGGEARTIHRVAASGGEPTAVTRLDLSRQERAHFFPYFLPDGRHFLYLAQSSQPEQSGIYLASLDSQDTMRLVSTNRKAEYAASGHLLFLREGTLLAQPFDAERLELRGEPTPVAERVAASDVTRSYAAYSVSQSGLLVYRSGPGWEGDQLVWFDRAGKPLGQVGTAGYVHPWLSPDEKRVAAVRWGDQARLWLIDLARGTSSRFTFGPADDFSAVWSPDGSRIVFASNRTGVFTLYQKPVSGTGNEELLLPSGHDNIPTDWSVDGRFLLYEDRHPKTQADLWVLPMRGEAKPSALLQSPFNEWQGQFSPDGQWVAYCSDRSGQSEVYVRSFPESGFELPISTGGGGNPRWRRDGKELFYLAEDRKLMSVQIQRAAHRLEAGVPRPLFETRVRGAIDRRTHYAVTADGRRFLFATPTAESSVAPITVVLNWAVELRR